MQSEPADTDTEGGQRKCTYQRRVRMKRVEFRENLRAFFRQGRSVKRLSVITRCPY